VRVHPELLEREQLPAEAKGVGVWQRRYREINDWERYLVQNGIVVVKLFLHLSYEEQCRALPAPHRQPQPELEFSGQRHRGTPVLGCLPGRLFEMLSETSTRWAPWHVLPADHKWFTRLRQRARWQTHSSPSTPATPTWRAIKAQMAAARTELEAELSKRRH